MPRPKSIKTLLDSNWVKLCSVAVATGAVVAGVVVFILTGKHEAAVARLEVERIRAESELKAEIAVQKAQFVKIERRIGSEQSFFDVSKLIVPRDRIKELDDSFKSMADGAFYIAAPPLKGWSYTLTSEFEMMEEMTPAAVETLLPLKEFLSKKNVHMWRNTKSLTLFPEGKEKPAGKNPVKLTFVPHVLVQMYSNSDLHKMAQATVKLSQDVAKADDVKEALKGVQIQSKPGDQANPNAIEATASAAAKVEQALARQFRGDVAALFLGMIVTTSTQMAAELDGARFELLAAQKKGNVLYVQSRFDLPNSLVEGRATRTRLVIDQELFLVTSPTAVTIVKVLIPSFEGRGDAYSWIGQWLAGFRLCLD